MTGMLDTLNGQLLQVILAKHPSTRLTVNKSDKIWRKSSKDLKYAETLFKLLLTLLPERSVVFVLLDSVSRMFGDKTRVDKFVESVLDELQKQENGVVVKMLVTDCLASSNIRSLAAHFIYVPDDVDGWNCGINMGLMEERIQSKLGGLEAGTGGTEPGSARVESSDENSSDESSSSEESLEEDFSGGEFAEDSAVEANADDTNS